MSTPALPSSPALDGAPSQFLLRDILHRTLSWAPDQQIVYRDQLTLTYAQLWQRIQTFAHFLRSQNISPGDRIGVLDWDSHRYLEMFLGIPMYGATLHTVNVRLTADQIAYTIRHAQDRVLIVHEDFVPLIESIRSQLPDVRLWILASDSPRPTLPAPYQFSYESCVESPSSSPFAFPNFDENTLATLFYTTGTTGDPKGVAFSHRQILAHTLTNGLTLAAFSQPISFRADDVYLPLTPMFHVHAWGLPFLASMLGNRQIYPGKYEPALLLRLLEQHQVTFSHCVPTILQMLLNHPDSKSVNWSRLKLVIGGAPLPKALASTAAQRGIQIVGGYGMSETCPIVAISHIKPSLASSPNSHPQDSIEIVTRTGFPTPLVHAEIMDPNGQLLPPGRDHVGELVLRSPWLTAGYLNDPARSADLWRHGWLHTGDLAYKDSDGYLRITDRIKDVIKIGGEWISSLELENALALHPAVREIAVVGAPDRKWDERPVASVVLREEVKNSTPVAALNDFLHQAIEQGTLHKRAILTRIRIVDALPRTSVGKIDKKALRALLVQESTPTA